MKGTLSMRKITEILRLHAAGFGQRQIARSLNLSVGAVHKYLQLSKKSNITWPLPEEWDEKQLRSFLFKKAASGIPDKYTLPDCEWIDQELKHKGVTLQLLHEEYKLQHPSAHYQYTQFCHIYNIWKKTKKLSMRHSHKFGEELFIDYAGTKVPIVDPKTGQVHHASIFVAVLGGSHYTYAEATWDQTLPHWIGSHVQAFSYFGGVPALLIPDNLKSGVHYACRYDPDINPSYAEMVAYYNTAVMPARPYKPKDKPSAEGGVLLVQRWILARLRHQTFYSLEDLNQAISGLLTQLNNKPFQKKTGSRYSQFKEFEQSTLKPLPGKPYTYGEFKRLRVGFDYHIEIEKHYYSVPHLYARQEVDVRISAHTVEVFVQGKRIASHERKQRPGTTTTSLHMLPSHRQHQEWTPESCLEWALEVGPYTHAFMASILKNKAHLRQAYRFFLGLLKLSRFFGSQRLEKACERALFYSVYSYKTLANFLERHLDEEPLASLQEEPLPLEHKNIRGSHYYK